jgi:hypothetical protein
LLDLATGRITLAEIHLTIEMEAALAAEGGKIERLKLVEALVVRLDRPLAP